MSGFRERDSLAERLPRLRAFASGLAWLREHDPTRHQRLARAVARYRRRAQLLGVRAGDVPPRYEFFRTSRYIVVNAVLLLLLLPLALAGTIIWYPTYLAPNLTLRLVKPDHEAIATYKIATGFVAVPVTLAICILVGALLDGWQGALFAALTVPFAGLVAIDWHERWQQVREDARIFLTVLPRADHRQRLAVDRARLVAEFDAVVAESHVPPPTAPIPAQPLQV